MIYIDSFLKNGIKPLPLDILGVDEWIKWLNFRPKTEEEIEMAALSKIYRTDKISFSDAKKYYNYVSKNSINSIIKKRLTSEELEEAKKHFVDEERAKFLGWGSDSIYAKNFN